MDPRNKSGVTAGDICRLNNPNHWDRSMNKAKLLTSSLGAICLVALSTPAHGAAGRPAGKERHRCRRASTDSSPIYFDAAKGRVLLEDPGLRRGRALLRLRRDRRRIGGAAVRSRRDGQRSDPLRPRRRQGAGQRAESALPLAQGRCGARPGRGRQLPHLDARRAADRDPRAAARWWSTRPRFFMRDAANVEAAASPRATRAASSSMRARAASTPPG